jgi:uncharacterized protein YacL (UPF0231 family)
MSNATAKIRFSIVGDELEVSAPPAMEALGEFFETEIGTSDAMLDLIEHHVRHDRLWGFTGNACDLRLDGETVTIEHNYTDAHAILTRTDLRALLTDLRALLTEQG